MKDYMNIGSTPCGEPCLQVGAPDCYAETQRAECNRFRDQLRVQFGDEPEGAALAVQRNSHDFGDYYEVICRYDTNYPASEEYALSVECDAWQNWRDNIIAMPAAQPAMANAA